ncbi:hypothetical protein [Helicobacter macacae]|uniref:hypothetical protein n=1 Tax=Helicobacter macacae TaxID=398626 RepID=UPI001652226B|nr:hypothetical protein [Helicobacter macacae]
MASQSVPPPFAEGARGWVNPTSASQAKSATANKHSISVIARESARILVAIYKRRNRLPRSLRSLAMTIDFVILRFRRNRNISILFLRYFS